MKEKQPANIYAAIYEMIESGKIKMGEVITESAIAADLGISRSPVREALRTLEANGIVTRYPGVGSFVLDLSVQDINELYDLRCVFEVYAMRCAIDHIPPQELEVREQAFLNLKRTSPPSDFYDADQSLHRLLFEYCGNKRLVSFYNILSAQLGLLNRLSSGEPDDLIAARRQHLGIIQALREKNAGKAEACLVEYIEQIKNHTILAHLYSTKQ